MQLNSLYSAFFSTANLHCIFYSVFDICIRFKQGTSMTAIEQRWASVSLSVTGWDLSRKCLASADEPTEANFPQQTTEKMCWGLMPREG